MCIYKFFSNCHDCCCFAYNVGESALLSANGTRSASCTSLSDVEMLVLSRDDFTALSKHGKLSDMLVRAAELQRKSYAIEPEGKIVEQKADEAAPQNIENNLEEGEAVLKKKKKKKNKKNKKKKKKKKKKKGDDDENGEDVEEGEESEEGEQEKEGNTKN